MRMSNHNYNDCVDCGLPCLGNTCPYTNTTSYFCDECGDEVSPDKLYIHPISEKHLCGSCILLSLDTVDSIL